MEKLPTTIDKPTANAGNGNVLIEDVRSDDFRFVYHPNPDRLPDFARQPEPHQLIHATPSTAVHSNVIYTPTVRTADQRLGCLYDEALHRIDASCVIRGRRSTMWNTDPPTFQGDPGDLPVYERPVMYLGFINGHFGHFMIESLARWWPLTRDRGEFDRFLVHVRAPEDLDLPFVRESCAAMGLNADNIVYFDHPVRFRSVLIPEPAWQLHHHIYTEYIDFMRRMALVMGIDGRNPSDQPVYLSRTSLKNKTAIREMLGEDRVESFLAARGVRIVHPQELSFREQIRVVNEHRHLIGIVGSQFQTAAAALEPKTITMFIDENGRGLYPLMKTCGHNVTYVHAIRQINRLSTYYKLTQQKLTGRFFHHSQGFLKTYAVDHERAIEWLVQNGVVQTS